MRRTIVFTCMCSIVGFCAVANSQQQHREPATLKPGFFGRMLGLESIPNPRLLMKESERVRNYQRQPQFDPATSPRSIQPSTATPMRPLPTKNQGVPRTTTTRRRGTAPTRPAPVITGGSASGARSGISITPKRRRSGLTLEEILKNRLSQPITKVERTAPWVQNPFHTDAADVYQPIASGPVPLPEVETLLVDNDPIEEPVAPMPLRAPMPATTELATPPLALPDTVIVTEPEAQVADTEPAEVKTPVEIPEPVTVAEAPEPDVEAPALELPARPDVGEEPTKLVEPVYPVAQTQEPVQAAKKWRARTQTRTASQTTPTVSQTRAATPTAQQTVVQRPVYMRPVSRPTAQPQPQPQAGHATVQINPATSQLPTITKIIQLAAHMMEGRAHESSVKLVQKHTLDEDFKIIADRRAVLQILLNLISNAVKFTPEGGQVTLTCLEREN